MFAAQAAGDQEEELRSCTHGGRPFAGESFVAAIEDELKRR